MSPSSRAVSALLVAFLAVGLSRTAVAGGGTALPPQVAYNYGEDETARQTAMAGALRALGSGTSGILQNPANILESRVYHLEALAQITPEAGRQVYGGVVVDSISGRLAGGVALTGGWVDPNGLDRSQLGLRLGLAYPITDRLFVGLGGRYAKVTQEAKSGGFTAGSSGVSADKASGGLVDSDGGRKPFVDTVTFDAGITAKISDSVYLGVLGQNLSYPNNAILPTTFGGGIGFGGRDFSLELDGLADFNSWKKTSARLMAGAEYLVADHFPLRLGYRFDQGADKHWISGGLGYIATQFSLEAAVRRSISDPGATMVTISLAYFLESSGFTRAPSADLD